MASDATKFHIFQQLFSIKILTKLSYWLYIFLDEILKYCSNAEKAVFAEVGTVYPYQICKKNEKIRSGSPTALLLMLHYISTVYAHRMSRL